MLTVFALILTECLYIEAKLFGDHVCQTDILEPREIVQWELKNKTVRTYKWCMNVPPRCSEYSHKIFNETTISVINTTKPVETCCEGFYELNNYCISMCQDCKNGLCLKGACICQSGWDGPNCDSRARNANEEIILTTGTLSSVTINDKEFSVTQTPTEFSTNNNFSNIFSLTPKISISDEYIFSIKNTISSVATNTFASTSTELKENTVTSSLETSTQDVKAISTISSFIDKEILNSFKATTFDVTSQKNTLEFSEEPGFINYTTTIEEHESKTSEEEVTNMYSTDQRLFDTTATQQTLITSTVSIKYEESSYATSQENFNRTDSIIFDLTSSDNFPATITPVSTLSYAKINEINHAENVTSTTKENFESDVDYRELGGQSVEEETVEFPKVLQNGMDENNINIKVQKTTIKNSGFRNNLGSSIEEKTTENIFDATAVVLDKPSILRDDKENNILKENFEDSVDDLTEEHYQKRSSNKNYSRNTLLAKNEGDNSNLIYSVCAASATTVLILIVAIIVFTLRSAKKKLDKNKGKKDVQAVAVYATSIFHSPLPDPPTFENPTYLSTGGNDNNWNNESNEEIIEVQEFNVIFQKPLKNPKLDDYKQYLYDHPPSTGSYRASSEVDTLSQYNLSHKSLSGIILEPVYDEIPSRDITMEKNDDGNVSDINSVIDTVKHRVSYVDNNALYVNTFGRTKF